MPRTNYARGREVEYKAISELKNKYYCFLSHRTSGSHSKVDVFGVSPSFVFFVQLKRTKDGRFPKKELEDLKNMAENLNNDSVVFGFWVWQDRKGFVKKVMFVRSEKTADALRMLDDCEIVLLGDNQ